MTDRRPNILDAPPDVGVPRIGAARVDHGKPLRQHEAAFVLEVSQRTVRNMLRRGELETVWAGRLRCIAVDAVAARVCDDPLAMRALRALAEQTLHVPRPASDTDLPALLADYVGDLR